MGTVGVLLILLGVTIAWLLGIKGLNVDQAINDVQSTLNLGTPAPTTMQPINQQSQANA